MLSLELVGWENKCSQSQEYLFAVAEEEKTEAKGPCLDLHEFSSWEKLCTVIISNTMWPSRRALQHLAWCQFLPCHRRSINGHGCWGENLECSLLHPGQLQPLLLEELAWVCIWTWVYTSYRWILLLKRIERLPAQSQRWLFGVSISVTLPGNFRTWWLLLIVKWMHPRIIWEGSLDEDLSRLGWSLGTPMGDCLVQWADCSL